MTDHNSPAGGNGGNQPPVQPGQFGPPNTAAGQQQPQPPQQQPQQAQQPQQVPPQAPQAPGPYGYPAAPAAQGPVPAQQPMASEAARAQVAAAWTRRAPQAAVPPGEAAVPALPPRQSPAPGAAGPSKKDRREQAKAERKAAYEAKKAQRESRKRGGAPAATPSAPPVGTSSYAPGGTATPAATPAGAPARTSAGASFDVPAPGGRLPATGRNTHVALRATLLFTACAFALGSCGVVGMAIGKSSEAPTAALDKKDVQKYRLTEFPTRSAATFAEKYAALCLTYDAKTAEQRREELARYATSGVDRDCGWNGQGTQSVTGAAWDGSIEDLPEYGKNGRYFGVQVTLSTGRVTTISVPVYVANLAAGSGLRIVGDVGEMPLPGRGTAPEVDRSDEIVDDTLSEQLKERVLQGYFIAWGASDSTAMSRFTTADATPAATSGLAGALTAPQIQTVEALAPAGTDSDTITYKYGQSVPVRVTVLWGGSPAEGSTGEADTTQIKRSYRLTVVNTAQGWFVKDVRGASLDPAGGRGDGEEPSASPSPGQVAPPSGGATTPPATGATQPPATNPPTKPATKPPTKPKP